MNFEQKDHSWENMKSNNRNSQILDDFDNFNPMGENKNKKKSQNDDGFDDLFDKPPLPQDEFLDNDFCFGNEPQIGFGFAPDLPGDDNDFNGFGMSTRKGVFDENSDFG